MFESLQQLLRQRHLKWGQRVDLLLGSIWSSSSAILKSNGKLHFAKALLEKSHSSPLAQFYPPWIKNWIQVGAHIRTGQKYEWLVQFFFVADPIFPQNLSPVQFCKKSLKLIKKMLHRFRKMLDRFRMCRSYVRDTASGLQKLGVSVLFLRLWM